MMETLLNIIFPGILISFFTAIITVHLSLKQFYSERLWERKIDSYIAIFESLHRLKHYSRIKRDIDLGTRSYKKDRISLLEDQWAEGDMEVHKTIDIGSFVICDDAIKCLKDYLNRSRLDFEEHSISDLASQEMVYLDDCIKGLKLVAQKDLKGAKKKKV